ncbi:class I SAM-dependent methyltransferase [Acaryochloris marina NIES-2412]|uniref:class I SAM-dependent methyltransferase n=1 Tax=Acaryochloris marina TaxID=155978 RepID=UPI004058378D
MHTKNRITQSQNRTANKRSKVIGSHYPEFNISGYTAVDGTVEFYSRINSLLNNSMVVLDFGAGRGSWKEDYSCQYRKSLHNLQGKVQKIVGCDIDEAIYDNSTVDEKVIVKIGDKLPFDNNSFDLIISDFTFEHIENDKEIAQEFTRILKAGGWICARTPNKYNYVYILIQLINNSWHRKILKYVQPLRNEIDVFPTMYRMNSARKINTLFPCDKYENHSYYFKSEPAYFFNNSFVFFAMKVFDSFLPSFLKNNLFVFLNKK